MGVFFIDKTTKPIISSIGNLKNITEQVANASIQLSDSAKQLSENSIKQATSIDQTSSSLEEMSNTISTNIEQVENVSQRSTEVSSISSDATNSMNQLEEAMKDILDSNDKIEQLVGIIKNIADKIKVLDEIVFQTKLLSFNASVEAERAGEYGRGFAVVAQEVGNLAVLSGKSAVEIDQIVKNSVKQTEEITKENKIKAQKGKDLALSTAKILNNISMQIANVNESSISVLGSSKQQKIGINQINQAMLEIDKASQENTTTAENTAKYANSLEDQVKALHGVVDTVSHVVIN
jgi:methyl-accepting chemotaxis protein